jgi:hypothetical protein
VVPDLHALRLSGTIDYGCRDWISGADAVHEHIVHEHEFQELGAPSAAGASCTLHLQSVEFIGWTRKQF